MMIVAMNNVGLVFIAIVDPMDNGYLKCYKPFHVIIIAIYFFSV